MAERVELLRQLPKVDVLLDAALADPRFAGEPRNGVADSLRFSLAAFRADILNEAAIPDREAIFLRALLWLRERKTLRARRVINATGVLLHTNLGRALLSEEAARAAYIAGKEYTALEFDCVTGKRGDRYGHVEALLQDLLGVESALVVNNNAAAVMLSLTILAKGREVIVSRGELVEIGGAFRVPEVMEQSGCILREVGTTNKTHLRDYENAIGENTAALLKVHTSNYRIVGFTGSVSPEALSLLGRKKGLPLLYDLGSGSMLPLAPYGIGDEPTVQEVVKGGADVVCFSGDKLLGGPQAGIIVGKKAYIDAMKAHPLLRVLRVDKMTLAALEATLRLYAYSEEAAAKIPLYQMLSQTPEALDARAARLIALLADTPGLHAAVEESQAQIGAGSVPCETVCSRAVRVTGAEPERLCALLLQADPPVVGRIHKDGLLLDMRTVPEASLCDLAAAVREAFGEARHE